jgi:flavin reductase (DIM6/NTAB) family NADH-FMN oxidoreductase RutF
MKLISHEDLQNMEQRFRANLINSITGFKSIALIGTQNKTGITNVAIFNSLVHIGANPALIGFIMRPHTVERHTLANILDTNYYTINHIKKSFFKQAHQTSAGFDKTVSEFKACGLTAEYNNDFFAPFVKESDIQLGVAFKEKIDIAINGTSLIIGEIVSIKYPDNCLQTDGYLDIEKAGTIACTGLDAYHTTTNISRLAYAKPNIETNTNIPKYID